MSLALRSVSPASVTSCEDLLTRVLRQAQQRTELQEYEAQANANEAARQQKVAAEAESRHSPLVAGLQQNVAGLQQNQATLEHMLHQCEAVIRKANTSFTRRQEEYQTAQQVRRLGASKISTRR
eukprot:6490682-Amphidinium_carterae.1